MAVLSEKVLWPVLAVFIFGIMAGFYIDDRRKMLQEKSGTTNKEHAGKSAEQKHAKNEHSGSATEKEHAGKTAETKHTSNEHAGKAAQQASSGKTSSTNTSSHASTSMSLEEYLAKSSQERSQQLEANVKHHQGFYGSIDEYLTGTTSTKPQKTKTVAESSSTESKRTHDATSMNMDEYQAQSSEQSASQDLSQDAYHGDIDGYLAKYGKGQQTPISKSASEPFNTNEHMGFHGSYEDYAKKYN